MNDSKRYSEDSCVRKCRKFYNLFKESKISEHDFAYNVILCLVYKEFGSVSACILEMSPADRSMFINYARKYIINNDFSPTPHVFMVDHRDPIEVEKMRRELRPHFEALVKHLDEFAE